MIGSGPNGLTGAIVLAQSGYEVDLYEAEETIGGGMRSAELTLPGFVHDLCSAIHPLGAESPIFREFGPLAGSTIRGRNTPKQIGPARRSDTRNAGLTR